MSMRMKRKKFQEKKSIEESQSIYQLLPSDSRMRSGQTSKISWERSQASLDAVTRSLLITSIKRKGRSSREYMGDFSKMEQLISSSLEWLKLKGKTPRQHLVLFSLLNGTGKMMRAWTSLKRATFSTWRVRTERSFFRNTEDTLSLCELRRKIEKNPLRN